MGTVRILFSSPFRNGNCQNPLFLTIWAAQPLSKALALAPEAQGRSQAPV